MGPWDGGGTWPIPMQPAATGAHWVHRLLLFFFFSFGFHQSVVWVYYFLSNKLVRYIIVASHSPHPLSSQCLRNYAIGTLCKSF